MIFFVGEKQVGKINGAHHTCKVKKQKGSYETGKKKQGRKTRK